MGFAKQYFKKSENDPAPLVAHTTRRVRFEEVDALGMVWHGRYPSYFEDGRIAFGDRYGLSYLAFRENRTIAPIVQMHYDFKSPLRFDETMEIITSLHWCEALRLNFSYQILTSNGQVAATGYTVQLFTDPDNIVLFLEPKWIKEFRRQWRQNDSKNSLEKI